MKIKIRDRNLELINELANYNLERYNVSLYHGDIFVDEEFDALVSPANSFGFMNGGIDGVYVKKYGQRIEDHVRKEISYYPFNELLVGDADIVPLTYENLGEEVNEVKQWLVVAPTMRVPMPIPPINVYLACRAAIQACTSNDLKEVVMPGMGTGVGNVPFDQAARAMVIGIEHALYGVETYNTCAQTYLAHQRFNF